MAIALDAARNAEKTVACATAAFTQPTSAINYTRSFFIEAAVVDDHVPTWVTDGDITPPTPVAQTAMPIVNVAAFYLTKVAGTERFT